MASNNKKSTNIKFSEIKKSAKVAHQKEKYELEDGQTIQFYPVFPTSQIDAMMNEMQTIFQTIDEDIELTDEITHKYVLFMTIKYFTHLKGQLKADTFIGQLNEMESIMDTFVDGDRIDLFSLIIDELFSPKEINKVFNKLAKISSNYIFLSQMDKKVQEEVAKLELKNKDILSKIYMDNEKQIPEA